MPAIHSGKVLVTGASGYIAIWVLKALLDRGFSVRGTVRSESKREVLKEVFKTYGPKLECVIVEDIAKVSLLLSFEVPIAGKDVNIIIIIDMKLFCSVGRRV